MWNVEHPSRLKNGAELPQRDRAGVRRMEDETMTDLTADSSGRNEGREI